MSIRRYPGTNNDLVQQLLAMKNQAQITGQVNPDYAPFVQTSLADTRERNYRDAMMGLQEKGLTLAQRKQAAQEEQFNQALNQDTAHFSDNLALQRQIMADEIDAAKKANVYNWINTGLGAGLMGGYLYNKGRKR